MKKGKLHYLAKTKCEAREELHEFKQTKPNKCYLTRIRTLTKTEKEEHGKEYNYGTFIMGKTAYCKAYPMPRYCPRMRKR